MRFVVAACVILLGTGATLAAQQPTGRGRISGRVVDALAEPLVAVEVLVATWSAPDLVLGRTSTDGEGRYVVSGLPLGRTLTVAADLPGRTSALGFPSPLSEAAPEAAVELRLWDAAALQVHVVDQDGAPLPGAAVSAASGAFCSLDYPVPPQVDGTSDADGVARLVDVPVGAVRVCAWAPGFGVGEASVDVPGADPVQVRLQPRGGMRLQVTAARLPAGLPRLHLFAHRNGLVPLPRPLREGTPGDEGTWHATGLPRDANYHLQVVADDLLAWPRDVLFDGKEDPRRVLLAGAPADTAIHGTLRDLDGHALAGQRIECRVLGDGPAILGTTDDDGRFSLPSPVAAGQRASLRLPGGAWVPDRCTDWLLRPGRPPQHVFVVDPAASLAVVAAPAAAVEGVVVDADGRPAPLAYVELRRIDTVHEPLWQTIAVGFTARDGSFAFRGLRAPNGLAFVATVRDGAPASDLFELADGARVRDLRPVRENGATVEGTVTGADGAPVRGAWVILRELDEDGSTLPASRIFDCRTDRHGRYRLVDVVAGHAQIVVRRAGGELPASSARFAVAPGGTARVDIGPP